MSSRLPSRIAWLAKEIIPHEPDLRRWLRGRISASTIDDVVQESYAILAALHTVEHILTPRTYLFSVAKSVMLKAVRNAPVVEMDRFAEAESLQVPCDLPDPETIVADRQELGRLASLIEELPPKCRRVFVLRKVQGQPQREVANVMGISENTVEKHMAKAMHLLGSAIGRGGNRRSETSIHDDDDRLEGATRREVLGAGSAQRH